MTGMADQMRLVLQGIYERKVIGFARILLGNWCEWLRGMRKLIGLLLGSMVRGARTIKGAWRKSWLTGFER